MKFQCGDFFALRGYSPRSRFIRLLIFITLMQIFYILQGIFFLKENHTIFLIPALKSFYLMDFLCLKKNLQSYQKKYQ